jgi:rSAM/selenodomain-associated transferase 2
MGSTLSVIIPALDEEASVARAIASVRDDAEVLVVDGGSRDRTREVAAAAGARVLPSERGRGVQLHRGAREAVGGVLVFLHADTHLEDGWAAALRTVPAAAPGGAFRFAVDDPRPAYRHLERGVALRCRLLSLPYGDQALFARRSAYEAAGGFPPLPLMEDVAFVRRLRRLGPLALLEPRAFTSPRRWQRHGLVGATLRNWWLLGLYAAGWPPERLARYYGPRPDRAVPGPLTDPSSRP